MAALKAAVLAGASPADLGRSLAYAAALRVARFGTANEHADWETALHVFTYANAIHQSLKRTEADDTSRIAVSPRPVEFFTEPWRSILPVLNVPPARLPGEGGDRLDDLPDTIESHGRPRGDARLCAGTPRPSSAPGAATLSSGARHQDEGDAVDQEGRDVFQTGERALTVGLTSDAADQHHQLGFVELAIRCASPLMSKTGMRHAPTCAIGRLSRLRMRLTVAGETPAALAMCWPERRRRRSAIT